MQLLSFALQTYARERDHLTHFLTYADNNAVGYFAKQGFTKEITLERERVRSSPSAEALGAVSTSLVQQILCDDSEFHMTCIVLVLTQNKRIVVLTW